MKVRELIDALSAFDPDDDVVVGAEGDDSDATEVILVDEERPSYIGSGPGEPGIAVKCRWVAIR